MSDRMPGEPGRPPTGPEIPGGYTGITGATGRRNRGNLAPSYLGTMPDPALAVPLPPSVQPFHEEVVISAPPALTEDQIEQLFTVQFRQARIYDDRLSVARTMAMRLYNGEPLGDEEEGRSQIVLTEVKDTIGAMMPTLVRTFAGSEHPVEFQPRADGDDAEALQAQDYVQHVCFVENDGFRVIHDAMLDAAQLKTGWIRWWWDYSVEVKTESYFGLLEPQCAMLINQAGVKAMRVVRRPATAQENFGIQASPEAQVVQLDPNRPLLVYDVTLTRKVPQNRPRIAACPSEQILIDPDATGPHDARFLAYWRVVTVSDLVSLGFPIEKVRSRITQMQQQQNRVTRRRDRLAAVVPRAQSSDPAMQLVRYAEAWMRMDYDGDGIAELHRVHAIGDYGFMVLDHEPASHIPMAPVSLFLVPHRAIGESVADRIGDLQRANTRVFRNIMDSMAESIHPRTVAVVGQCEIDDVMSTEMGTVIREFQPGMVRELSKPFIGPQALQLMEALQAVKESRTGITRTSQGLTADALQSTTAIAVSAQIMSSADRLEFVVRTLAECMRRVYEGVLRLCCEHQDRPRLALLRGKIVPIDPRAWIAGFNVVCKVGVGRGTLSERMGIYGSILAKQEQALQTMGPQNPLVTLGQYSNTLHDMVNIGGISNTGRYFNALPTSYTPPPPPPPPPTPDQIVANAQMLRAQSDVSDAQAKQKGEIAQMLLEDGRLRDEARAKSILEAGDLAGKYGLQLDVSALGRMLDSNPALQALLLSQLAGPAPGGALPPGAPPPPAPPGMLPGTPPAPGAGPPPGAPGAPGGAPPGNSLVRAAPGAPPGFLPPALIQALAAARPQPPANPMAPASIVGASRPPMGPPPPGRAPGLM